MKRIFAIAMFSLVLILFSFTDTNAQGNYSGTHPHRHLEHNTSVYGSLEASDIAFDPCSNSNVYVTYSEILISKLDLSSQYVEIAYANSLNQSHCQITTDLYNVPSDFTSLGYMFYIEYNDGTYEYLVFDY